MPTGAPVTGYAVAVYDFDFWCGHGHMRILRQATWLMHVMTKPRAIGKAAIVPLFAIDTCKVAVVGGRPDVNIGHVGIGIDCVCL